MTAAAAARAVLAGRLALLAVSGALAVAALRVWGMTSPPAASTARYRCPMHPGITSAAPGECTVCGMALVAAAMADPVEGGRAGAAPLDVVRTSRVVVRPEGPGSIDGHDAGQAILAAGDATLLKADESGWFFPANGGPPLSVRVAAVVAPAAVGAPTRRVAIRAAAAPAGHSASTRHESTTGWLRLAPRTIDAVAIPGDAVTESPDGPFVLVGAGPDGARDLRPRPVRLASTRFGPWALVVWGLRDGDHVATVDVALADAARRAPGPLQPAAQP